MNSNSENSTFIGILIPVRALQVSYASNLLRVIQAAIRELAQSSNQTNQLLSERPPPEPDSYTHQPLPTRDLV